MPAKPGKDTDATAELSLSAFAPPTRGILTLSSGDEAGRVIPIAGVVTLGRSADCTVPLLGAGLSRVHARCIPIADRYVLQDLDSTNGTWVNDRRIDAPVSLQDGDRVRLGTTTTLRFSLLGEAEERAMSRVYEAAKRRRVVSAFGSVDEEGEALHEDLLSARDFQRRALRDPPEMPGVAVEILYRPLDLVGGDLYHVAQIDDRVLRVFIADSTGHGVKSSLTTMLILSEYDVVKKGESPGAVLRDLNGRMTSVYEHVDVHFTALCIDLDLDRGILRHATAAHPGPYVVHGGEARELECGGTLMGLLRGATFPEWEERVPDTGALVAFTDGATDARASGGPRFGEERLRRALEKADRSGAKLGAAVSAAIESFVAPGKFSDDLTLVAIRWKPVPR